MTLTNTLVISLLGNTAIASVGAITVILIEENLKQEIGKQVARFKKIHFLKFPICYVHGDLISTNLMFYYLKDKRKKLSLIDFSSSGIGLEYQIL